MVLRVGSGSDPTKSRPCEECRFSDLWDPISGFYLISGFSFGVLFCIFGAETYIFV